MTATTTPRSGDPYILIEGGLVQNAPALPVLDLDVLSDEHITTDTVNEVRNLMDAASALELPQVVTRCAAWLNAHAPNPS
jgi:hypothetical protein